MLKNSFYKYASAAVLLLNTSGMLLHAVEDSAATEAEFSFVPKADDEGVKEIPAIDEMGRQVVNGNGELVLQKIPAAQFYATRFVAHITYKEMIGKIEKEFGEKLYTNTETGASEIKFSFVPHADADFKIISEIDSMGRLMKKKVPTEVYEASLWTKYITLKQNIKETLKDLGEERCTIPGRAALALQLLNAQQLRLIDNSHDSTACEMYAAEMPGDEQVKQDDEVDMKQELDKMHTMVLKYVDPRLHSHPRVRAEIGIAKGALEESIKLQANRKSKIKEIADEARRHRLKKREESAVKAWQDTFKIERRTS